MKLCIVVQPVYDYWTTGQRSCYYTKTLSNIIKISIIVINKETNSVRHEVDKKLDIT